MLPVALTLLAIGLALCAHGLIGRRVGDEPRCRKCKYNLTGVEAGKCPECGRPWTPATAARGLRHRRKRPLAIGATVLLIGAGLSTAIITGRLRKTNWFTHLPTPWVVPFAARGNIDAFTTLADRFDNDKLTPSQINDLAESGLTLQADPQLKPTTQDWIDLLARLEAKGKLTPAQHDRFYSQFVLTQLAVRRPAPRDRFAQLEFECRWRCPKNLYLVWRLEAERILLDNKTIESRSGYIGFDTNILSNRGSRLKADRSRLIVTFNELPPLGIHELCVIARSTLESPMSGNRESPRVGEQKFRTTIEFVEKEAVPRPTVVDGPDAVQDLVSTLEFTVTPIPSRSGRPEKYDIDWRLTRPSPCDAWIQVRTRPRRGALTGIFDFEETIQLHEGVQPEVPFQLGQYESIRDFPDNTFTLWLYADDGNHELDGVGTKRLKPGIALGKIQVPIQPAPAAPPPPTKRRSQKQKTTTHSEPRP